MTFKKDRVSSNVPTGNLVYIAVNKRQKAAIGETLRGTTEEAIEAMKKIAEHLCNGKITLSELKAERDRVFGADL